MTSVAFQSYCYLIENATSKKPYFHYATYYLPIPHTAQVHWAISQKIDPLMCLTIDQSFYSMSYHNLFKNFSKKRENKTAILHTGIIWQDKLYDNIKHVKNNFVGGNTLHNKKHQWTTINNVCEYCYRASPCYLQCK